MTIERQLILQEKTLEPADEWPPRCQEWLMVRVSGGVGYWLQHGVQPRQLMVGDGLIAAHNPEGVLRASQLEPLKLQFFTVWPQYLNGLLTVVEWHHLEVASRTQGSYLSLFSAGDFMGREFAHLAGQSNDVRLTVRCGLLGCWANAIDGFMRTAKPVASGDQKQKHHETFRRLMEQITEAELAGHSPADLCKQFQYSERHFRRLFREAFGVPLRARQTELRLQRARQLLEESNAKVLNIAGETGYRRLTYFSAIFKRRFGMTPSEWRRHKLQKGNAA